MKIQVNGEPLETEAETLAGLLAELERNDDLAVEAVATALNGEFAPAAQRGALRLKDGDAVEIVSPRQGG